MPVTFLAHIREDKVESIVLVMKKEGKLKLVYNSKNNKYMSYDEFVVCWTGVVIAIEKEEETNILNTVETNQY